MPRYIKSKASPLENQNPITTTIMSSFDEDFLRNSGGVATNSLCENIDQGNQSHDAGETIKI
jgi:hypothetical protein